MPPWDGIGVEEERGRKGWEEGRRDRDGVRRWNIPLCRYMARSRSEKEICRVTKREERGSSKGKEGELRFVTLPQPPSPPLAAPRRDMRDGRRPSVRPSFRPSVRVFFFLLVFIGEGGREGGKELSQLQPDEKGDGSCYSVIYVCMYAASDGCAAPTAGTGGGWMHVYICPCPCLRASHSEW